MNDASLAALCRPLPPIPAQQSKVHVHYYADDVSMFVVGDERRQLCGALSSAAADICTTQREVRVHYDACAGGQSRAGDAIIL